MKTIKLVSVELVREGGMVTDASVSCPKDAVDLLCEIASSDRENFVAIHLDTRNKPTAMEIVSIGTLNAALVHPREVFKAAILNNAGSIILGHNHPSGDVTPSREDIELTRRLVQAGDIVGIDVLDHVIVGPNSKFISMKEANLF